MLAFDTETYRFSPGNMTPRVVCLTTSEGEIFKGDELLAYTTQHLLHREVCGHFVAYDWACIMAAYPHLTDKIFEAYDDNKVQCTRIREILLDIATDTKQHSYSLANLASKYLQKELDKHTWRTGYEELDPKPLSEWPQGAIDYAIEDAITTKELFDVQGIRESLLPSSCAQARASFWLHLCAARGMRTDPLALMDLEHAARESMDRAIRTLEEAGLLSKVMVGRKPNKTWGGKYKKNQKLAQARLLEINPNCKKTATGKPSITEETISEIRDDILEAYVQYSNADRERAYIEMLKTGTRQPIHTRFTEVLKTGRTSATARFQNPPRSGGFRECFIPRPGHVFIAADYSGLELAAFAQVCYRILGYSRMRDVINDGRDVHTWAAAQLLGMSYEEAYPQRKSGKVGETRQMMKAWNFGKLAAMGYERFSAWAHKAYNVELSRERHDTVDRLWHGLFPEVKDYHRWVNNHYDWDYIGETKRTQTPFQLRPGGMYFHSRTFTQVANLHFQGLAAVGAKEAGWLLIKNGLQLVNFVHDEFISEERAPVAEEKLTLMQELMIQGMQKHIPDVKISTEGKVMRRWEK